VPEQISSRLNGSDLMPITALEAPESAVTTVYSDFLKPIDNTTNLYRPASTLRKRKWPPESVRTAARMLSGFPGSMSRSIALKRPPDDRSGRT
jgi:hypothetical protein